MIDWSGILPVISALGVVGAGAVLQNLTARRERHAGARKSDAESESLSVATMSAVLRVARAENDDLQADKRRFLDIIRALRIYLRAARDRAEADGHHMLPMPTELHDQLDDLED